VLLGAEDRRGLSGISFYEFRSVNMFLSKLLSFIFVPCQIFPKMIHNYSLSLLGAGLRVDEGTSPYCTEDELVKFWDGKTVTVPAFDIFRDVEELHAKHGRKYVN
jgi:hypothetical protein